VGPRVRNRCSGRRRRNACAVRLQIRHGRASTGRGARRANGRAASLSGVRAHPCEPSAPRQATWLRRRRCDKPHRIRCGGHAVRAGRRGESLAAPRTRVDRCGGDLGCPHVRRPAGHRGRGAGGAPDHGRLSSGPSDGHRKPRIRTSAGGPEPARAGWHRETPSGHGSRIPCHGEK